MPVVSQNITQHEAKHIEVQNEHEFPSLGGSSIQAKPQNVSIRRVKVYGTAGKYWKNETSVNHQ